MPEVRTCSQCGAPLTSDAPDGFCPACALQGALDLGLNSAAAPSGPAQPETRNPEPGTQHPVRFGDYELLGEIARGGMGIVYRARQVSLDRVVALKLILFGRFADEAAVKRFRAESTAAARLQHANIVAIHEVGEQDGQHFFSMDYIEGKNLADLMREGPVPARRAAGLLKTIAEAIHYAHGQGIVHRDLKPSNILLDTGGEPRVTDFGLAKNLKTGSDLTLTGQVLGSPNFIAPEQASGKVDAVGPCSDIFSLGAILYQLLTGRPPFTAESLTDTLHQVLTCDPPSPRLLNPAVPRDLETICLKCLQKKPDARYITARVLADELARFLSGEPIHARPVAFLEKIWRWTRRKPAVAALTISVAVLFLMGFGGVLWELRRAEAGELMARRHLYAADMSVVQEALEEGNLGRARVLLEAHRPKSGAQDLRGFEWRYFWKLCQGDQVHVLRGHSNGVHSVAFSPDGTRLVSASHRDTVLVWNLSTKRVDWMLPVVPDRLTTAAFSPDGRILATGTKSGPVLFWDCTTRRIISTIDTDGKSARAIFSPVDGLVAVGTGSAFLGSDGGNVSLWDYRAGREIRNLPESGGRAAFSADGRLVATGMWNDKVKLWEAGTGRLIRSIENIGAVMALAVSPDSRTLATSVWQGPVQLWDVATGELLALLRGHGSRVWCVAFAPDGKWLATGSSDQTVRLWDLRPFLFRTNSESSLAGRVLLTNSGVLRGHGSEVWSVAFSPDGSALASGGMDEVVLLWSTAQKARSVVITNAGINFSSKPQFNPGGTMLLARDDTQQVTLWDVGTGNVAATFPDDQFPVGFVDQGETLLTFNTNRALKYWNVARHTLVSVVPLPMEEGLFTSLAPNGKTLALARADGKVSIWDLKSGRTQGSVDVRAPEMIAMSFSPDSRFLATATEFETSARLWDWSTGREVATMGGHKHAVFALAFGPDGRVLATGSIDGTVKLWDARSHKELATLAGHKEGVHGVAFSPDGKTLVSANDDHTIKLWNLSTYREIATLKLSMPVWFVTFSLDGRTLASSGVTPVGASEIKRGSPLVFWSAPSLEEIETQATLNR